MKQSAHIPLFDAPDGGAVQAFQRATQGGAGGGLSVKGVLTLLYSTVRNNVTGQGSGWRDRHIALS